MRTTRISATRWHRHPTRLYVRPHKFVMSDKVSLTRRVWRAIYPKISRISIVQHVLRARNSLIHYRSDPLTITQYLTTCRPACLHLGCGPHIIPGWLNSDLHALRPDVICIDASKRFPIDDNLFDYVFTEHMIEHLCLRDACNALSESFRILKPGGRIRVSTPDLDFITSLTNPNLNNDVVDYISWSCEEYTDSPITNGAVALNNFVRNWGHQFIFDKATLDWALRVAGFRGVRFFPAGKSESENLRNLENVSRLPPGFVALESLCAEAVK